MKCTGIRSAGDDLTFEEFAKSALAETSLGKLLMALVAEKTWSNDYGVFAFSHEDDTFLKVSCRLFEHPLIIADDGTDWTVQKVEEAVREHLRMFQDGLQKQIKALQDKWHLLERAHEDIDKNKALAAIVAKFPEAAGAEHLRTVDDLHAFTIKDRVFVIRKVGTEFTGDVIRFSRGLPQPSSVGNAG